MDKMVGKQARAGTAPDPQLIKPRRGQLQDQVLHSIRHGLMVGAFVPGQIMSLRKLAARLGTSPMPVRDALSQLIAANVLEALPNRSVRVPRLSETRLKELTEVRVAVEGMAARWACMKTSRQLVNHLEAMNVQLIRAIEKRDIVGCLACNQRFHFDLYRAAESEVLMPLIESLWLQCGPTMYFSLISPDVPWDASAHKDILKALRVEDPAAAQRAITRDIRTTARHLAKGNNLNRLVGPLSAPSGYMSFESNRAEPSPDAGPKGRDNRQKRTDAAGLGSGRS